MNSIHPATAIAEIEFRRVLRVITENRWKLALNVGVFVVILAPLTVLGVAIMPTLGLVVREEAFEPMELVSVIDIATGGVAIVWLVLVGMSILRTVTSVGNIDESAFLLLGTSIRSIVLGLLGREFLLYLLWVGTPTVILTAAFSYGFGSIIPLPIALFVLVVLIASAIPVGFLIGIWIRHLLIVFEPIARFRSIIAVAAFVLYFVVIFSGWVDVLVFDLFFLVAGSPLGWIGHVLLIVVPGTAVSVLYVIAGLSLMVGLLIASIAVGGPSARYHWTSDAANIGDRIVETDLTDRLSRGLDPIVHPQTRIIAVTTIRRARRAPVRVLYAVYPLFFGVFLLEQLIRTGSLPVFGAVGMALGVIWAAGALFTLNPLGDPGRALPTILTAPVTGRKAVAGLVVAGVLIAVPVGVLLSISLTFVTPLSTAQAVTLVLGTVIGSILSPMLATGIGSVFPRFGSVRVTRHRKAVMPSKTAFMIYTMAIALPTVGWSIVLIDGADILIASLLSAVISIPPAIALSIDPLFVRIYAWIGIGIGAIAPFVSYRIAIRRFDRFRLR